MRTLLAATLVLRASTHDETSLMQGLARRVDAKLGIDSSRSRHDTSRLMETATKMLKSGVAATPTVLGFLNSTVTEITDEVNYYILNEHYRDQQAIFDLEQRMRDAMDTHSDATAGLDSLIAERNSAIVAHKQCRQTESAYCSDSRLCEIELERLWEIVKLEEARMRELHYHIHGEICVHPPDYNPPCLGDHCWNWPEELAMEGPETSQTSAESFRGPGEAVFKGEYPHTDYECELRDFRYTLAHHGRAEFYHDVHCAPPPAGLGLFQQYIAQKPVVEAAWRAYNTQILLCADKYDAVQHQTADCDYAQDTMARLQCEVTRLQDEHGATYGRAIRALEEEYASTLGQCHLSIEDDMVHSTYQVHTSDEGEEMWTGGMVGANENGCTGIRAREYDRKREWQTLHAVKCLLETVYSHVVHAIETGEPCPTMESDPDGVQERINYCHVHHHNFCDEPSRQHFDQDLFNAVDPCLKKPPPPEAGPLEFCAEVQTMALTTHQDDRSPDPHLCIIVDPPTPTTPPRSTPPLCSFEWLFNSVANFGDFRDDHLDPELERAHAHLSAAGWGGCAAPRACIATLRDNCPEEVDSRRPAVVSTEPWECHAHEIDLPLGGTDHSTFRCHDSLCVPIGARCNGQANCDDGSDELGCEFEWSPANIELSSTQACPAGAVPGEFDDVRFFCNDGTCTSLEARCNGVPTCADGSDEEGCSPGVAGVSLEPTSGHPAHIEAAALNGRVFSEDDHTGHAIGYARRYTFKSLGSFAGKSFIRMSNEDKNTPHDHVQMKLRFSQPTTVSVMTQHDPLTGSSQNLPWLASDGWTRRADLEGVEYSGLRETPAKEWAQHRGHSYLERPENDDHLDTIDKEEQHYGTAEVWQKTFEAGVWEMRGNGGGEGYNWAPGIDGGHGSYLMFLDNPRDVRAPPSPSPLPGHAEYIGCFVDDPARDLGAMVGSTHNAATNTFDLCRQACGDHQYMSLQYGGECFCANSYSTAPHYQQVDDSLCNRVVEPCSSNSHNCGGTWHQAIYEINPPPVPVEPVCALQAYWEYGNCGCGGNDQNANWCGGLGSGNCPSTVETNACPSGQARLAEWHPKPYGGTGHRGRGTPGHLVRDGCEFIWHAQYACIEPQFCCQALTAECLACQAGVTVSTFCADRANIGVDGCLPGRGGCWTDAQGNMICG